MTNSIPVHVLSPWTSSIPKYRPPRKWACHPKADHSASGSPPPPSPSPSSSPQPLPLLEFRRLLDKGSATRDTCSGSICNPRALPTSCNSLPSFEQLVPFSYDKASGSSSASASAPADPEPGKHSGLPNFAEGVGTVLAPAGEDKKSKRGGLKDLLSSQEQKSASTRFPAAAASTAPASSSMPATFPASDGQGVPPISISVPHSTGSSSVFLPRTAIDIPFPERLRLVGGTVSMSSIFQMALTCCVVAQWIKIAGGLNLWASRLRLRFFESPLIYKTTNSTKPSKLGRVGMFWDLENCPVPTACSISTVIDKLYAIGNNFGEIQCFRAYGKLEYLARQAVPFLNKGVELCPVPDGKESADKAIILDAGLFAFDHKTCPRDSRQQQQQQEEDGNVENDVVMVVTGDRGFAPLLKELSRRNITTFVIGNAHQSVPSVLCQSADFSLGWEDMMISSVNGLSDRPRKTFPSPSSPSAKAENRAADESQRFCSPEAVKCYELDSDGSELLCTTELKGEQQQQLHSSSTPWYDFPKVLTQQPTREQRRAERHQAFHRQRQQSPSGTGTGAEAGAEVGECSSSFLDSSDTMRRLGFSGTPIGGRVRVLRHLRYEIAAIADKYCNKGASIGLREFTRLYELEMGHALVPGHYGCGSLRNLLESMPDLLSLRPTSTSTADVEIVPFYPKGKSSYGKINYSQDDLRSILYELLRATWPNGLKRENLGTEHVRVTGRPLVLVAYEFLKAGDVFASMRDIVHIDPRTKLLHLVEGAQEPAKYGALSQNCRN